MTENKRGLNIMEGDVKLFLYVFQSFIHPKQFRGSLAFRGSTVQSSLGINR